MAACDANTGWTKSEFRDICQNKLAQLSVDVFSTLGVRSLCIFVAPLFHCFCASSYQPPEPGISTHIFQKSSCFSVRDLQLPNSQVQVKRLPLTLAFTFTETIFAKVECFQVLRASLKGLQQWRRRWGQVLAFTHMQRDSGNTLVYTQGDIVEWICLKGQFHTWTEFRFECMCKLQSCVPPLLVGVTCPNWVGLRTFAHFCIREKSRSSTKKCFSCLHKPKDRPHSAAAPAAL